MKTIKWKAGDIYFDTNGRAKYISNEEKASQDIAYYILRELYEIPPRTTEEIRPAIASALVKLRADQELKNVIDPRERIGEIKEFLIIRSEEDPETESYFFLTVSTESGDDISKLFDRQTYTDLSHLLEQK